MDDQLLYSDSWLVSNRALFILFSIIHHYLSIFYPNFVGMA